MIPAALRMTEEAANLILYLAKDAPAYLVNQEIVLDGGIL